MPNGTAPTAAEPVEIPARVLAAAKKSPIFASLLEAFDPQTSEAALQISFEEAEEMIRRVFCGYQAAKLPLGDAPAWRYFPLTNSGWQLELRYLAMTHPNWGKVVAILTGPDYRPDYGPEPSALELRRRRLGLAEAA